MMKRRRFFTNRDNIVTSGVILISLCALIVSMQQTRIMSEERELMHELSRKSVWPILTWGTRMSENIENNTVDQFSFILSNNGIGPAIVTGVKCIYKGEVINDWWELFDKQNIPDTINRYITNSNFSNRIIKPGEVIEVLNLNNNLPLANEFSKKIKGVKFEIYYESIYNEVWKYEDGGVIKLDTPIKIPVKDQFRN